VATIRDVAHAAGVSIATVSRVYNGNARVSDATGEKVRSAAALMNYWPNNAARSLTTSRTHTLGVLLPDLYGDFFSEVIRGIDHAARRNNYQILVSSSHANNDELLAAARAMRGRIDGLIAMAPDATSTAAIRQVAREYRVVLLNPLTEVEGCDAISIANYDGSYALVRHLLGLGHRRIAMVKGPAGNVDAEERLRGYRHALRDGGVEPWELYEIEGDFTEAAGYESASVLLGLESRPTAVFAANDYMAIGLLSALREADISVPQGLAVTGFDNISIAQHVSPPLTTVHVAAYELGERAVSQWLETSRGGGGAGARRETLATTLVVRRSCGSGEPSAIDVRTLRPRRRPLQSSTLQSSTLQSSTLQSSTLQSSTMLGEHDNS